MQHKYYINHLIYQYPIYGRLNNLSIICQQLAIIYENLNLSKTKNELKKNQLRKFHLTNLFPVLLFHLKRINNELYEDNIGSNVNNTTHK